MYRFFSKEFLTRQIVSTSALAVALTLSACGGDGGGGGDQHAVSLKTLSSPNQYVSGGTALVQVVTDAPGSTPVTVLVNGADESSAFRQGADGTLLGVVTNLVVGNNTITAKAGNSSASQTLTNYPLAGPIISGPHITPFICQTEAFKLPDGSTLGQAIDADCSAQTKVTYMYMPKNDSTFKPLPAGNSLPEDVASTTTLSGQTVPFVIRVETGTINRGIYQTAVLHDPTTETLPTPLNPPKAWNKRAIAIEGFGCAGGWYIQGNAIGNLNSGDFKFNNLDPTRLGEGYATFSNTLQHASNSCNALLSAEAAMMTKEHLVKTFGAPEFTVSAGCSGGSYGSMQPTDIIPGLFDGVLIMCTFPDPLGIALSGSDGHLLTHYFSSTNPSAFTEDQQVAVSGYKNYKAFLDAANQAGRTDPVSGRVDMPGYNSGVWNAAVPASLRYDPGSNPVGARPTVYDWARNVYGVDANGFAKRPFDNVGVQYGLAQLNSGVITVDQFLDLNEKIGGYDNDSNYVASRTSGDPGAIERMYKSGMQLVGNGGLASIPVFDITGIYNDDSSYHYQWFHFATRDRLVGANGDSKNHVMWRGNPVPAVTTWDTFIKWVSEYKADGGSGTQRDKVIRHKPSNAIDGCWSDQSTFIAEAQTLSNQPDTQCNTLFPSWTFPRRQAGGPVAADIAKCQLKAVNASDYKVALTAEQLARLKAIFPSGVCDWTKPGVNQTKLVPFPSFGPSPVNLVFDITKP
ncbi:MAG: DUF6351 family protein [Proteobacteria bacterium]|nr:DUF6351 family protein [Pseudomonadota bacterium]